MAFYLIQYITFQQHMRHSKSLKVVNRTTAAVSTINSTKKNEKVKHIGGKNKKKVKRNSTGNMEVNMEQRPMRRNKDRIDKVKEDIFKGIGIEKCQPIAQIEKPTLVDSISDYLPRRCVQMVGNMCQKEVHYNSKPFAYQNSPQRIASNGSSYQLERKNNCTVKIKQEMPIFSVNRLAHRKKTESLLDNLDGYITALKKTQPFITFDEISSMDRKKVLLQGRDQNQKERQLCFMLNKGIAKAQVILDKLIQQNYYQTKRIEKNNKRHYKMKHYLIQVRQKMQKLSNDIYIQKIQRKRCQKRLQQYGQIFMAKRMKSKQKLINIYRNFQQQQEINEDQSGQIHIYQPNNITNKQIQEGILRKGSKDYNTNKKIQQRVQKFLNYNYASDSDIRNQ